jgi:hypothetical protein
MPLLLGMRIRILAASLLVLAGCTYVQDSTQLEATIITPGNFRAGTGVIESVGVLPKANKEKSVLAGARRAPDPNLYRLSLRMDAGGFQTVDIDDGTFLSGEFVELTNDGRVVRLSGTTLNDLLGRAPTKPQ